MEDDIFKEIKKEAAITALKQIADGMVVGLGSGSTSKHFIDALSESGIQTICVPTSNQARVDAIELGLDVMDLDEVDEIDIAVDGVDSIGKSAIVKGLGGALTKEKIVDYMAKKFIIIADERKLKEPKMVPVEVLPFAYKLAAKEIEGTGLGIPKLRRVNGYPLITDNGNFVLDVEMEIGARGKKLEQEYNAIPGVIENGLFTRKTHLIVGHIIEGEIKIVEEEWMPEESK